MTSNRASELEIQLLNEALEAQGLATKALERVLRASEDHGTATLSNALATLAMTSSALTHTIGALYESEHGSLS